MKVIVYILDKIIDQNISKFVESEKNNVVALDMKLIVNVLSIKKLLYFKYY